MQVQAWNFQWDHNNNERNHHLAGDLVWEGIDHNRGYFPEDPVSKSGVLDIFRLPKFSFYFYQSQREGEPVLFPAVWSFWDKTKNPGLFKLRRGGSAGGRNGACAPEVRLRADRPL